MKHFAFLLAVMSLALAGCEATANNKRFFIAALLTPIGSTFPQCSIATLDAVRSSAFAEQYNNKGSLPYLGPINNNVPCGFTVLSHANGTLSQLTYSSGRTILPYGLDGAQLCNGPYNETMMLGCSSFQNSNQGAHSFVNFSQAQQNSFGLGAFPYGGSLALVDCGVPPPSPPNVPKRFFLAAFNAAGYGPTCSLATLEAFQSDAFMTQYNTRGALPFTGPIDNSLSCGITILSHTNGTFSQLTFSNGRNMVPYGLDGAQLCNGPYNETMMLGCSSYQNSNDGQSVFVAFTQWMVDSVALSSFEYGGSLALVDCGVPPPALPNVPKRFFLAAYNAAGYGPTCSLATLDAVQSRAFMTQYNANGALSYMGPIYNSLNCDIAIMTHPNGTNAILTFSNGRNMVPYGLDGAQLCNGPYNETMMLGCSSYQNSNDGQSVFVAFTQWMQAQFSFAAFSTGTLALVDCGVPPVRPQYFKLGAFSAAGAYPEKCRLATFDDIQSHAFIDQYNYLSGVAPIGNVNGSVDGCFVAVADPNGVASLVDTGCGTLVIDTGVKSCAGPLGDVVKLGFSGTPVCVAGNYSSISADTVLTCSSQRMKTAAAFAVLACPHRT